MKTILTVTQAFGDYAVGAQITEAEDVRKISKSHPRYVVRSAAEPPPALEFDAKSGAYVAPKAPTAPTPRAPSGGQ